MKKSSNNPAEKQTSITSPVRVKFTKAGFLFLLVSILIGVSAIKGKAPMMLVIFMMMFVAVVVSVWIARRNISKIRLRRDIPPRVWQYKMFQLGYYLRNTNRRANSVGLTISEQSPEGIVGISGYCLSLPSMRNFRAQASLTPTRRGKIILKRVNLSTTFPFGLVRASKTIRQTMRLVVWPARGKMKTQLLFRGAMESSQAAPSQASGGQDEFFGLREYRPGDNPRWIHWKSSALKNTPIIREMAKPLPEQVWVIIDTYLSDFSELSCHNREKTLRFAVTLIEHAFRQGYEVGAVIGDDQGPHVLQAAAGKSHRTACFDQIAAIGTNTIFRIEKVLEDISKNAFRHSQLIVISPQDDSVKPDTISLLRSRSRHVTLITPSNIDRVFDDSGNNTIT